MTEIINQKNELVDYCFVESISLARNPIKKNTLPQVVEKDIIKGNVFRIVIFLLAQ
ncbi:MAG: hypothetical protein ACTSXO_05255 [Candidatus Heimdallarchaeota archaeon]